MAGLGRGRLQPAATFTLDPDIDLSLCALLGRVLPLASHYSAEVGKCEDAPAGRDQPGPAQAAPAVVATTPPAPAPAQGRSSASCTG